MEKLSCRYCGDEKKNNNSLRNHERLCKSNPEKQTTPFQDSSFVYKRSNGYIKAKENNTVFEISDDTRKKLSDANRNRSLEVKQKIASSLSKTIQEKVRNGEWHTSLANKMHYNYNGVDLHGKWELNFAKYLDTNNIKWERATKRFKYYYDGKFRYYTPDFYLVDEDIYVEIKGYKTEKDDAKWSQFSYTTDLKILREKDLKELGIL